MIMLDLVVGILAIFSSGITAYMYRVTQMPSDLWCSMLGFVAGTAVLINMIGRLTT
jgi:hypothetical protein